METKLVMQLDGADLEDRLQAVQLLRQRELETKSRLVGPIGPSLPSYDHIHSTASYGFNMPGVYSVAHMVWAAHEARARSIILVEHESTAHFTEATRALDLVNRDSLDPLQMLLAVEFKAQIDKSDLESKTFADHIGAAWGQDEAAWVVGMGAIPSAELSHLAHQFQQAKREKAERQMDRLNRHLHLDPPLELSSIVTPEGNITDRALSHNVATRKWPMARDAELTKKSAEVRRMLNPNGPGYVSFQSGLPSFQDLIRMLSKLGMTPTFTAQLRGKALESQLPVLRAWGMRGVDIAGIEPDEPDAEQHVDFLIKLATEQNMFLFGGSDYRGAGTGWKHRAPWMDHSRIRDTFQTIVDRASPH